MKKAGILLVLFAFLAVSASAHKAPGISGSEWSRVECDFAGITWEWDGSFVTEMCDTEGLPIWQYGLDSSIPQYDCDGNPIGNVLGTVLNGAYPSDAGERAILGTPFEVSGATYLLELCHYYDTENSYDGGNVELLVDGAWVVIDPMGGYPDDLISDSASYYAWCVNDQPGFTDGPVGFIRDCFDLTQFMGMTVQVAVKFGSDSSVTYPGWFIHSVVAGGETTTTQSSEWSTIKSLY